MLLLQITSAVTAVTLVVLAIAILPVLAEMKKTAESLRDTSEKLQKEIIPLIEELRDTISDVQVVTKTAAARAEGITLLMDELGHAGHNIRMINKVIGIASDVVHNYPVWMTGAKVAGKYIADRIMKIKSRG